MKKGFKAVTAAALAVSALTPVAAFAAESTVDNGVYTSTNYYSIDAFKKLSGSAKASALTSEGAVIVIAGKVYTGNNVITLSDSQLGASAVTVDAYNAANGNKLVSGKPIGGENQTGDLKVESVSAINTTVNAATNNQVLPVQINGSQSVTVKQLTDAGYIVKFSSNKAVFSSATTSTTGVVDSLAANFGNFNYTVEVTKDGKTISSAATGTVTLVDASATKEITEYEIKKSSVKLTSGTLNVDDSGYIIAPTKGTNVKGDTVTTFTGATFTSSDNKVALVGTDGTITPVKAGTVTITIKHGTATKAVTLTITEATRTLTTLKADKASVGIVAGGSAETLTVKGYDQLGDEKALSSTTGSAVSSATAVATVGISGTGDTRTVTVTPVAQGSATITVTVDGKTLSIPVTVGENKVTTRKVEIVKSTATPANSSDDAIIDKAKVATDDKVVLAYNGYNASNQLVGAETLAAYNATTPAAGYSVDVTVKDPSGNAVTTVSDYVTVSGTGTKQISLTAKKAGTATVTIYDGALKVTSYEVTLKDSTPTVSAVKFETGAKITASAGTSDVIKTTGLTFTSTPATTVKIAASTGTGTITDSAVPDNTLGTIDLKHNLTGTSTVALSESSGTLVLTVTQSGTDAVKGTVNVRIKDNTGKIVDVKDITVDIAAVPTAVVLATGSVTATAGDKTITGLTSGTKYVVTSGSNYYGVKADGTLATAQTTLVLAQGDAVGLTGTAITGLTNGTTYKVEVVTP